MAKRNDNSATEREFIVPKGVEKYLGKNMHNYSAFFRYSSLVKPDKRRGKSGMKFIPFLKEAGGSRPIPEELKKSRALLLKAQKHLIELEYKPEKLIIGSSLSPYSGDASTALHSIYGVPYIEGSSLKGLVRSCIIQEAEGQAEEEDWFKIAFGVSGSVDEKKFGQGNLIFFDSFPKNFFKLEKDIQTPHYGDYYNNAGTKEPTDDSSVNMFNFYTAKNTVFTIQVAILEKALPFKEQIANYLKMALNDYGVGGKTSVGYGLAAELTDVTEEKREIRKEEQLKEEKRLKEEKELKNQQLEKERLEKLSPFDRLKEIIEKLNDSHHDLELSKRDIYNEVLQLGNNAHEIAALLLQYWERNDKGKKSKKQQAKISHLNKIVKAHMLE